MDVLSQSVDTREYGIISLLGQWQTYNNIHANICPRLSARAGIGRGCIRPLFAPPDVFL